MSTLDDLKTRIANLKGKAPPEESKPTLASILARAKSISKSAKESQAWRDPEEEVYNLEVPRSLDVNQFILRARADFPRLNVTLAKANILRVEGLASYRWLKSRLN